MNEQKTQPLTLPKQNLQEFLKRLDEQFRVVVPVAKDNQFVFAELDEHTPVRLDYNITILPPKKFFFPQYETLLKFGPDGRAAQAAAEAPPTVIVGMHPCDVYATWLLDEVFSANVPDPYYLSRRKRALIIALDCKQPCDEHQFCLDMGSLYVTEGFDMFWTDLGDRYLVEPVGQRGEQLTTIGEGLFSPAGPADLDAKKDFEKAKSSNFKRKVPCDAACLPQIMHDSYDSLIWDAAAQKCFSCGTCNLVCPTCYCFNVFDELDMDLKSGQRKRQWDGCMLPGFAEVAGGENFRESRASRLRHRMFRKGAYLRERYGKSGCVGCGRCDRQCVAGISALKTYQQISEQFVEAG